MYRIHNYHYHTLWVAILIILNWIKTYITYIVIIIIMFVWYISVYNWYTTIIPKICQFISYMRGYIHIYNNNTFTIIKIYKHFVISSTINLSFKYAVITTPFLCIDYTYMLIICKLFSIINLLNMKINKIYLLYNKLCIYV